MKKFLGKTSSSPGPNSMMNEGWELIVIPCFDADFEDDFAFPSPGDPQRADARLDPDQVLLGKNRRFPTQERSPRQAKERLFVLVLLRAPA